MIGELRAGAQADLVLWDVESVAMLCGWLGPEPVHAVVRRGEVRP